MYKCKKCGTETEGNFCPECGEPINAPSEVKDSEAVTVAEPAVPFEEITGQPTVVAAPQPAAKPITVLAGSKIHRSYLNKGLSKKLWIFGIIAIVAAFVLGGISAAISSGDVSSKAYVAHTWYEGMMVYTLYTVTPEHFNTVIVMMSLSSFVFAAACVIWAVRKSIVYPEAARLLNGTEVNSMFIYYEGLNAEQKKAVDAQCQVNKTYSLIRILTYIGSAIILCCAAAYLCNAIGVLAKYYNQFDAFIESAVENADYSNSTFSILITYCSNVIIAFLAVLLVYDIIFIFVRKSLNNKAFEQLRNVKL